jgi:hypothetical protein
VDLDETLLLVPRRGVNNVEGERRVSIAAAAAAGARGGGEESRARL